MALCYHCLVDMIGVKFTLPVRHLQVPGDWHAPQALLPGWRKPAEDSPPYLFKELESLDVPRDPSYIIHFIARAGLLMDLLPHGMPTFLVVLNVLGVDTMDILIYSDGMAKRRT